MKRQDFILALETYLPRKGLSLLLSRMPGIRVIKELDSASALSAYLTRNSEEFLIVSQQIFDQCKEGFITRTDVLAKTLVIRGDESKEALQAKIDELLSHLSAKESANRDSELTAREEDIVKLVSLGMTNRQIAGELFLSTHTVITHRKNISSKLGIKSASGLTIYAIVNNLVTIEEASSKAAH